MDRTIVIICGLLLIITANLPDLLGRGHRGFGEVQLAVSLLGLAVCAVSFTPYGKPWSWMKRKLHKHNVGKWEVLLIGSSILFTILAFELALRLFASPSHEATEFGWSVEPNHESTWTVQDTPESAREVTNRYFEHGFKRWPESREGEKTVLIIGDSMTEMNWVSNGEEWYSYLEDAFPRTRFFVFGAGGYGSLQEYMILNKYYDEINPDLIIWQFCNNDYHNNLFELDLNSYPNNNHMIRPYLVGDDIVFRLPLPFSAARNFSMLADKSLLIYDRIRKLVYDLRRVRSRPRITRSRHIHSDYKLEIMQDMPPLEREAFDVTLKIMTKIRNKINKQILYFINLCSNISYKEKYFCNKLSFICIDDVYLFESLLYPRHEQLRVVDDLHFNKKGNQIIGKWLVEYFKNKAIF